MKRLIKFRIHIIGLLCLLIFPTFLLQGTGESDNYTSETQQDRKPIFHFGNPGFITEWLIAKGFPDTFEPYPAADRTPTLGYGIDYLLSIGGETDARPEEGTVVEYKGCRFIFERVSGRWVRQARRLIPGLLSGGNASYGCCYIQSKEDTTAWLLVGSPWYCQVWVNGRLLYLWNLERSKYDPEVFPVSLRKGMNTLLVKNLQVDGRGNPRFLLTDEKSARQRVGNLFKPVLEIKIVTPDISLIKNARGLYERKSLISVDIQQAESLCPDLKADITVSDTKANARINGSYIRWERLYPRQYEPEGNVLFQTSTSLGTPVEMILPQGIYRVCAQLEGFFGRTILGETALVVDEDPKAFVESVLRRSKIYAAQNDFIASIGWLNHLSSQIEKRLIAGVNPSGEACWWTHRLLYWLDRLEKDPMDMLNQRNWMEWAYLSKVDSSGQPFLIQIPESYDPERTWPLHLWLHGSGQHHLSYRQDEKFGTDPEAFHLSVFARSKSGGYIGLSEIDVLEALDFVKKYWHIDPKQIHLYGYSMGGGGTYWIGSRYPHQFATLRPQAAGRIGFPMENLFHLPVYHVHSRDDSRAPFIAGQAVVDKLNDMGYECVMDATDKTDHWIWNYKEGIYHARQWADRNHRVKKPRDIWYTALDEIARGAYWTRVVEWGNKGRPAHFRVRLGQDNNLYLSPKNVGCLQVDLVRSPADRKSSMSIFVDGTHVHTLEIPLPEKIYVRSGNAGWTVTDSDPEEPEKRLHFPGGIMALYHGEPLMIVWGTRGDPEVTQRIARCAQAAQYACHPSWPQPEPWEKLPRFEMPFGKIPGKPDTAVTDLDMKQYNLILIGDAQQNTIVESLINQLPVQIKGNLIISSDGLSWSFKNRVMGLLYYNPVNPKRLVYLIASSSSDFYTYETPFFMQQTRMTAPPDFIIVNTSFPYRVAARRFDSRWQWETGYIDSQQIPLDLITDGGAPLVANAMRKQTGADFALFSNRIGLTSGALGCEGSRYMDFLAWAYDQKLNMMEISGRSLKQCYRMIKENGIDIQLYPDIVENQIEPKRNYHIVMIDQTVAVYVNAMGKPPDSLVLLNDYLHDALKRYLQ